MLRTIRTGGLLLLALLMVHAAPVAVADDDCVAVEKDGVMVYPEGCTDSEPAQPQGTPQGGNGG